MALLSCRRTHLGDAATSPRWRGIAARAAVSVAFLMDAGSLYVLLLDPWGRRRELIFWSLHVFACTLFAVGMRPLLPAPYRDPRWAVYAYWLSLSLFFPVLGIAGAVAVALPALYHPKKRVIDPFQYHDIPELPHKTLFEDGNPLIRFSEGGLAATLRFAQNPDQRLSAVMALRQLPDQQAMPILRLALGDSVDDVRLLAYSMIDRKDQEINGRIQRNLRELELAETLEDRFVIHRALGQDYWELAYLGVADGDVLEFTLFAARRNILTALEIREDVGARFLMGRIALWQKDFPLARSSFQEARKLGLPESSILPYLAEIDFYEGRYAELQAHLRRMPPGFLEQPPLKAVASFWLNA